MTGCCNGRGLLSAVSQARVRKELSEAGLAATPGHPAPRPLDYAGIPSFVPFGPCIMPLKDSFLSLWTYFLPISLCIIALCGPPV